MRDDKFITTDGAKLDVGDTYYRVCLPMNLVLPYPIEYSQWHVNSHNGICFADKRKATKALISKAKLFCLEDIINILEDQPDYEPLTREEIIEAIKNSAAKKLYLKDEEWK